MQAVPDNGVCENLRKLRARLGYFADRFPAAGIVIAGVDAVLVDSRSRAQHTERVEQMYLVSLFRQPDGSRSAVNTRPRYRNLRSHIPLLPFRSRE
jgi:hypothetical protein